MELSDPQKGGAIPYDAHHLVSPEDDVPTVDEEVERRVDHHQQMIGGHHVGGPADNRAGV